jgi:hypothetical protein
MICLNYGKKLHEEDSRAVLVLILAGIVVGMAWWFNATLVYDDIGFSVWIPTSVHKIGWFKTLIRIFLGLDLTHEYRTYGLSRIVQFLLWSSGMAFIPVYTVLIALSHLAMALALYALLVLLRVERIIALSLGLMWLFSPFIWTSCFHHYSYLILPVQIAIIGFCFLVMRTEIKQQKILAVGLGIALALTGELHLVPIAFALIVIAVVSRSRSTLRASFLAIFSMMLTIVIHYAVWKTFAADYTHKHRYTFSFFHDRDYWIGKIFAAVRGIGHTITDQLSEIAGHDVVWLITTTIMTSLVVFACLTWVLKKRGEGICKGEVSERSSLGVAGVLLVVSLLYLAMSIGVAVLSNMIPPSMQRRYGFIPLTLMLSAIILAVSALVSRRLSKMIVLSVLIGVMVTLFVRHQGFIVPATRAADDKLSEMIGSKIKEDPTKPVLFFRASENTFPLISIGWAGPGPAMRPMTSDEISQAKYGIYWVSNNHITLKLGAPFTGELGRVSSDKKIKILRPESPNAAVKRTDVIDGSKVIIVANLGFDEYDPLGKQVRVFSNFQEFEPYFFSKQIVRNVNNWGMLAGDVVAIDLGAVSLNGVSGNVLPDKHLNDSKATTSKDWLINYGWLAGGDSVYKHPSISICPEYYRTNRNGNFDYAFKFLESDVIIDLDFWELFNKKPGERFFDVQVSWNDGAWVSLGHIDMALINGEKPFSIRLSHQNTHSFKFRLSSLPGTRNVPFIQGVRIARRTLGSVER